MAAKPQPHYARLTQPPRSPNGRNRQAAATNHSDPLDGAGAGAGGAGKGVTIRTGLPPSTWRLHNAGKPLLPGGITYIDPGIVDVSSLMQDFINRQVQLMKQAYVYGINYETEPFPIPYTGIHSGELTGHRAWMVTNTYELTSLAHYFVWEPRKTVEGNVEEVIWRHPLEIHPPRYGGVYAYSSFDLLRDDELQYAMMAQCDFPRREEINRDKRVSDYTTFGVSYAHYVTYLGLAFGTVKLWGETVEHEKGYRASFAKVTGIDGFIGVRGFDLEKLRGKYLG